MQDTPEFIDVYSDDIGYILEAYEIHKEKFGQSRLNTSSTCRILICVTVNSIDFLVSELNKKANSDFLKTYLTSDSKVSHNERMHALKTFFLTNAYQMPNDYIDDFLLMKRLRNIITHANWRPQNKIEAENAGFPSDVRYFEESHIARVNAVYQKFLLGISCVDSRY